MVVRKSSSVVRPEKTPLSYPLKGSVVIQDERFSAERTKEQETGRTSCGDGNHQGHAPEAKVRGHVEFSMLMRGSKRL
jgi:hypothetical protein